MYCLTQVCNYRMPYLHLPWTQHLTYWTKTNLLVIWGITIFHAPWKSNEISISQGLVIFGISHWNNHHLSPIIINADSPWEFPCLLHHFWCKQRSPVCWCMAREGRPSAATRLGRRGGAPKDEPHRNGFLSCEQVWFTHKKWWCSIAMVDESY